LVLKIADAKENTEITSYGILMNMMLKFNEQLSSLHYFIGLTYLRVCATLSPFK
jgi:hypothetical protein